MIDMARFGQIPPYGANFRHGRFEGYDTVYSPQYYALKADARYWIRPVHGSKRWVIFYNHKAIGSEVSMTKAMAAVLEWKRLLKQMGSWSDSHPLPAKGEWDRLPQPSQAA